MTIVVAKDGVMAVDSLICIGESFAGAAKKWSDVPIHFGGGFVAWAGRAESAQEAMRQFISNGGDVVRVDGEGYGLIHLRADGSVATSDGGPWIECIDNVGVIGSGHTAARGALHMGATAMQAAEAACSVDIHCGGPIYRLEIEPGASTA